MLIKKNEEPFFHRFLSIAKEIIKKNGEYLPILFGDDEKLYLACDNYAAVYDFQSNLLLDDELREFGKVPYELSELPNGDLMLTKADHFNCQDSYLIAVKQFFEAVGYLSEKVSTTEKGDPYRIAKLTESTGCWLSEFDNKILDKFKKARLYMCDRERTTEFESIGVANGWNPNYLAVYDEVELNGGQTTISMTIYFNIKDDPKHNAYDQQEMEFVQQPAEYDVFEDMDVEEPEVEVVEDDYQEEEQLDALLEDTVVPEELEDDFDPMRA
ncbi:hypothetical protein DXC98_01405 [Coprobacillus sp. TF10-10]|nr:hypothetical protein DXC98_01405 [Coprobacillus sp. TF10-10]DAY83075.1 MAG TPA: hypothetical protein [Caudoviricetes sp.]